ncbi:NLR family CARD domain-containing protein 3-like [Pygocentrus nattereri]|nr:NLR family CARD domain-containing protein 3-like [Pygocentrus nattereri]
MEPQNSSSGGETPELKEQRAASPMPCFMSMSSNSTKKPHKSGSGGETSEPEEQRVASPMSSSGSISSNSVMEHQNSNSGGETSERDPPKKTESSSKEKLELIFKEVEHKLISLVTNELKSFKDLLSQDFQGRSERGVEDEEYKSIRKGVLKSTLHILQNMNQTDLANALASTLAPSCHQKLKLKLRDKFQTINEGISTHEPSTLLNEIYTELYITDCGSKAISEKHELKQIVFKKEAKQEQLIKCSDIFKLCSEQEKPIRTVLTQGITGIGKTVSVQKFILDWAEGKVHQDIFMFPLPFRELNLLKNEKLNLISLLHCFFPETQELKPRHFRQYKIMFIFDGLDECRLPLNFQSNDSLEDIEKPSSVDMLLTNLIKGNLLPSALIWLTSQPAAVSRVPPECVDRVTEVRGFTDLQKQEYFRKRISDPGLASKMIKHVRSSGILCIMCHIPVFCWIIATVLERMLGREESGEMPQTLTQVFTHYLIFQFKRKSQKHSQTSHAHQTRESIQKLGKLAFHQLNKGNLIYEEDLQECGISVTEATVYSGMCTQIFREEFCLYQEKVFSFVHLSIQQFLAALYTFLCFVNENYLKQKTAELFLNSAVDKALQSENGHMDLFLRFLLGLSLESNHSLLQDLLAETESICHSKELTVKYIKKKIIQNASPDKSINLIHCLNELNDHSLVQEVQMFLQKKNNRYLRGVNLSPAHWSALAFLLLNSEEELDEFDLNTYEPSEDCLLRLFPVVKVSRKAMLSLCNLGEKTCENLQSALQSPNSSLKELDLSNNDLQDSGIELLSVGLKSLHCKLEILKLSGCMVTEQGCSSLASALKSNPSHLKELDLTYNYPGESGAKLLSAQLEDPQCRLTTLRMDYAGEIRIKPGLRKYACELTLDPNTVHANLSLSEGNRKVTFVEQKQSYPDHPERFDGWEQVLCRESLTGRCYWEAKLNGTAEIAVSYKGISRKGDSTDSVYGCNEKSWSLYCSNNSYSVVHKKKRTVIPAPASLSNRVGVYLDCPAGSLSFYSISADTHMLTHLHTFSSTFTEPLYAGFWVYSNSSVYFVTHVSES